MGDAGFAVSVDAVVGMRMLLNSATEAHLAARDGEASGGPAPAAVVRPLHAVGQLVAAVLPSWHAGLDRRWQAHHTGLLRVQDEASAALDASLSDYMAQEAALVACARGDATNAGPARTGGGAGLVPTGLEELGSGIGGDCDTAATAWRRRRDLAADTADTLSTALKDLGGWTGPAATSFTTWAERHLVEQWRDLAAAAEAVSRALLDQPAPPPAHEPPDSPPPDEGPAPRIDLPDTPPPSGLASVAPRELAAVPVTEPPTFSAATSPASGQPSTAPPPPGDDVGVPAPRRALDVAPVHGTLAGGMPLPDSTGNPAHQPSTPSVPRTPTSSSTGAGTDEATAAAPPAATGPDTASALSSAAPIMPSAAIAGAHALARDSMAHHVIREITIPPVSATPAPPSHTPPSTDGVLSAPHRWRGPDPTTGATPATPAGPYSGGRGDSLGPLAPVGPDGTVMPWRSRRRTDRPARPQLVVNLDPATPAGAWVDLVAHRAVGLHGPGATAVARTALRWLHAHTPAHLVVPRATLDTLTTDDTGTPQLDTACFDDADDERVHVVPDPYTGLQQVIDYVRSDDTDDRPCLLVVPAPISTSGRNHLRDALATVTGPVAAAALLLGLWPGTCLDLDAEHVVDEHRRCENGVNLTGWRLHPTSAADLAHQLDPTPAPTTHARTSLAPVSPDAGATEPDEPEIEIDPGPVLPFALSVLGPVELRYRQPQPDGEQRTEGQRPGKLIGSIPRLARELLAWLAVHPEGATRDQLLTALCPDTTARRRDSNLHAALSLLRRSLTETTGDRNNTEVVITGPLWTLNPALVAVDVWALQATRNHTEADPQARRAALRRVVTAYTGLFASDLSGLWAHSARETVRRRYLEVLHELVNIELADGRHRAALDLLERAREQEPLNETVTRAMITLHLRDNDRDAARSTYEQLRVELAAIDTEPEPSTRRLVTSANS
ncbi:AfsR/SARP family transcriptional regulator [Pseudonocardia sp. HH130630-07]|uniref:AfsR/SARP family transcriptional regulator n=1 Tax=Pseudonocardia sp. HH130630-07 TaxID=1690815 RepID=UPI000814C336|nr:bacterial transcriptional activator domain-containing protein [Pseudonocardia sp. HH130630-07]ANY05762.1 hypothetical protein AFB00_04955 [Pseudonocardia sp. HH130630-07]